MPFSTTAEFRTAVKSWSKRNELTDAEIDDFTLLFEAEIFAELRVRQMETVDAAFAVSSELTALPTGFRELRSIRNLSSAGHSLELSTPQDMADRYQSSETGQPIYYVIEGSNFRVAPAPDGAYTFRLDYYKAPATVTTGTVNWLLTNWPQLYLFGTLRYVPPYIGDDERIAMWEAWYQKAKQQLITEDQRSKRGGSQPAMKIRVNP